MEEKEKANIPIKFKTALERLLGEEAELLIDSISNDKVVSVRYNLNKEVLIKPGDTVPWCSHARYLPYRPNFTHDPLFQAGCYYVQEASSMLLFDVLKQVNRYDNPLILDLCAAPGGKSTTILDHIQGKGFLIVNEVIKSRCQPLIDNIKKWAYPNVIVCNNDAVDFQNTALKFDIAVIDAPCSGEGMFRKSDNAIHDWSEENVALCSARQKRIVADILPNINEGGTIIYSTCTFNEQENIDNVKWICQELKLDSIALSFPKEWGIEQIEKDSCYGYQCFPHKVKGEGFFIAVLKKKGTSQQASLGKQKSKLRQPEKNELTILNEWICIPQDHEFRIHASGTVYLFPSSMIYLVDECLDRLRLVYSGIKCGKLDKSLFIPDHALALSNFVAVCIPRYEMDTEKSLLYLKKQLSEVNGAPKSWILASYKGFGLGWLKNLGNRINNYLPVEWMVRK